MAINHLQASAQNIPGLKSASRGPAYTLTAESSLRLAAAWFERQGAARAVAPVCVTTGCTRGFYAGFAQWLASRG
ncbi:hypothetical protein ACPOLB_27070 [Rubrivivax sp. RP6-9]|uniref:hypothetical protein n=1 Tax=Rubrivivax sp. RP6-9 TaxID=3415750 RepID=UPI003CC5938F